MAQIIELIGDNGTVIARGQYTPSMAEFMLQEKARRGGRVMVRDTAEQQPRRTAQSGRTQRRTTQRQATSRVPAPVRDTTSEQQQLALSPLSSDNTGELVPSNVLMSRSGFSLPIQYGVQTRLSPFSGGVMVGPPSPDAFLPVQDPSQPFAGFGPALPVQDPSFTQPSLAMSHTMMPIGAPEFAISHGETLANTMYPPTSPLSPPVVQDTRPTFMDYLRNLNTRMMDWYGAY